MTFDLFVPGHMWTVNESMHFRKRAPKIKAFRTAARLLTDNHQGPRFDVPVTVDFYPHQAKAGKLADTANHLWPCKAVLDGVVDAGLLDDDTPEFVVWQRFHPPVKSKTPGVRIVIRPA